MRPLIGITMNLALEATRRRNVLDLDYGNAVYQAGGFPVAIPCVDSAVPDIVRQLDGFLFTGGDDISPRFYREKPLAGARLTQSPDPRTLFEIALCRAAVKAKKPLLAICYGTQLVNVALGGRLYQDIELQVPDPIKHGPSQDGEKVFHAVDILEGTYLSRVLGASRIKVRSAHHQCVKNPGRGLHLSAVAHDRVIEALELRNYPFLLAVQWHPEKTPNDRYSRKLFQALVHASRK